MLFHNLRSETCPVEPASPATVPYVGSWTFQHLLLVTCGAFAAATVVVSLPLVFLHLSRYTIPNEQRQLIRMMMVPIVFSVLSTVSIIKYSANQYITPIADFYEAIALVSVFLLFVNCITPDESTRDAYYNNVSNVAPSKDRQTQAKTTMIVPCGSLAWFNKIWITIFAFLVAFTILIIAQEASQATGKYCAQSLSVHFGHVWIMALKVVAIIFAIMALLRFYGRFSAELKGRHVLRKVLSFKLLVFLNTIQELIFSIMHSHNVIHGTPRTTTDDLSRGIPALMLCIESLLCAIIFWWSFPVREYSNANNASLRKLGFMRAIFNTLNPSDIIGGIFKAVSSVAGGRSNRY